MELRDARCTNCGASLTLEPQKTMTTCTYCQSQIMVSKAIDLALVEVDRTKDIEKFRRLLDEAIQKNSIKEIERLSAQIKDIIPSDFEANYYFAYSKESQNEPSFMTSFFKKPLNGSDDEIKRVVKHLIQRSDLRNKAIIAQFLTSVQPEQVNPYLEAHAARARQEDQYANIPRDIFICFSSKDTDIAEAALKFLEKDGYSCWIATRNLRPEDSVNYWDNIGKAIKNASLVLVISSEAAMLSKDVQHELELAKKNRKKLFEYKIDDAPHTSLFKYIFDGIKWVDGSANPLKDISKLPARVLSEIKMPKSSIIPSISQVTSRSKLKKVIFAVLALVLIASSALIFTFSSDLFSTRYTVQFVDHQGRTIVQETYLEGADIIFPEIPERAGFVAIGWSSNVQIAQENLVIEPVYQPSILDITFLDANDNVISRQSIPFGNSVSPPQNPTRLGHVFLDWDHPLNNIQSSLTIRPQFEILTFNVTFLDNQGQILKEESVPFGSNATPPDIEIEGFEITSWTRDFSNIRENIVTTAIVRAQVFQVQFVRADGSVISTSSVNFGESVTPPTPPLVEGFEFEGWSQPFTNVRDNLIIQAQYRGLKTFQITFNTGDGSSVTPINVIENTPVNQLPTSFKEGHIFAGWFLTSNLTQPFVFGQSLSDNIVLYARFQSIDDDLSDYYLSESGRFQFIVNNDAQMPTVSISQTSRLLNDLPIPTREGYIFTGWSFQNELIQLPFTVPENDKIILKSEWIENEYGFMYLSGNSRFNSDTQARDWIMNRDYNDFHIRFFGANDNVNVNSNEVIIIEYTGRDNQIVLPEMIHNRRVNHIWMGCSIACFSESIGIEVGNLSLISEYGFIESIRLPRYFSGSVDLISVNLSSITVEDGNEYYESKDGVLYRKGMERLVYYPPRANRTVFNLPDSVKIIQTASIYFTSSLQEIQTSENSNLQKIERNGIGINQNLRIVSLPQSFSSYDGSMWLHTSLQEINVHPDNPVYMSIDGMLVERSTMRLVLAPSNFGSDFVLVPDEIRILGPASFSSSTSIREIRFSDSSELMIVEDNAISSVWNLERIVFPPSLQSINFINFDNIESIREITFKRSIIEDGSITQFFGVTNDHNGFMELQRWDGSRPLPSSFKIFVPADSLENYRNANGFERAKDFIVPLN